MRDTQIKVASATISRITEKERWAFPATDLYPTISAVDVAAAKDALGDLFIDPVTGELILAIHNYVIEIGGTTIVVDTCNGNGRDRPNLLAHHQFDTDYLDRFAEAGFDADAVNIVVSTHLHPDHCGWNTVRADGEWKPTFPNARYIFFENELSGIEELVAAAPQDGPGADLVRMYHDSIDPVLSQAERIHLESEYILASHAGSEIVALPAPGHTPGHVVLEIRGEAGAVISGDVIHHPLQLAFPKLSQAGDSDPVQARATRDALIERCANEGLALLTSHFPGNWPIGITRGASGDLEWTGLVGTKDKA